MRVMGESSSQGQKVVQKLKSGAGGGKKWSKKLTLRAQAKTQGQSGP